MRDKLIKEIGHISDKDIKIFVVRALKEANEEFWKVPASSSGKEAWQSTSAPPRRRGHRSTTGSICRSPELTFSATC